MVQDLLAVMVQDLAVFNFWPYSHNDVLKWSCDFMVGSPSLYLTTLQTFRHCGSENKRFLIFYMISEDHVLCGFMGGSSLSLITPLPRSMTKDLVAVEI